MCCAVLSLLSRVRLFVTAWTVDLQAPLSVGFPRQECWSCLPFPLRGDLRDPGIKPGSPALQADSSPTELPGMPITHMAPLNSVLMTENMFISWLFLPSLILSLWHLEPAVHSILQQHKKFASSQLGMNLQESFSLHRDCWSWKYFICSLYLVNGLWNQHRVSYVQYFLLKPMSLRTKRQNRLGLKKI